MTQAPAAATPFDSTQPRPRSQGEKLFDDVVYTGLNGIGTFVLTLPVAYALKHGAFSKQFNEANGWLQKKLPQSFSPKWNERISKSLLGTTVLMQGGNLMLLPVSYLEHHKVRIVQGLNVMLGDTTDPSTIEEAPKQTLGSLLYGRLRAFSMVFGAFFMAELLFEKPLKSFEQSVGRAFKSFMGSTDKVKALKHERYGELAALDVFATAAASVLMYEGSHKIAAERARKNRPDTAEPAAPGPVVSHAERAPERLAEPQGKALTA